eukprot:gene9208-biopygen9222
MLWATAIPSKVDVPRPSSSRTRREWAVAFARISDVSEISTRNDDCPSRRESCEPSRTWIESNTPSFAFSAGTNDPICARSTAVAACLM